MSRIMVSISRNYKSSLGQTDFSCAIDTIMNSVLNHLQKHRLLGIGFVICFMNPLQMILSKAWDMGGESRPIRVTCSMLLLFSENLFGHSENGGLKRVTSAGVMSSDPRSKMHLGKDKGKP